MAAGTFEGDVRTEEVYVDLRHTKTTFAHHSRTEVTAEQELTAIMAEVAIAVGWPLIHLLGGRQ